MVTILAYHGVTDVAGTGIENFQGKHMPVATFAGQMGYLRDHETVLRLGDVVDAYTRGGDPDGVVVTFDDGYRNNLTVTLPVLERFEIPVTFFFSTGFIGKERMFWVDEVEMVIDATREAAVDLTAHGVRPFPLRSRDDRMAAVTEIKAVLKRIDDGTRDSIVAELKRCLPPPPGFVPSQNYRTLTWDEVVTLARSPFVEIGAHSVDHPILTKVGAAELEHQVRGSKRDLERHLGHEVTFFAYPNGERGDYDDRVKEAVRAGGFRCACTTLPGENSSSVGLYDLRRSIVGFCDEPFPFPMERSA
jgi:peptidoglycan/xylan/chitin deacetylase (PgdA/CDA1 family)